MYNAIYLDGLYYLLPEEFADYDAFINDLLSRELPFQYRMTVLREDHDASNFTVVKGRSMAPYFLSGYHDEPSLVTIANPEDVYPAQVYVMDQVQYNAKLREVINRVCPGCQRFKPLSNRVQSLNGHFGEMTLDGVCLFRQESKYTPRIFHDMLFYFGGYLRRTDYKDYDVLRLQEDLKWRFYIRYTDAALRDENGHKTLTVQCKKKELLAPIITNAISRYTEEISYGTYHIRLAEDYCCTEEKILEFMSEKNCEAFRKECKKFGVSIAVLQYDEDAKEKVQRSLKPLVDNFLIFPLLQMPGKSYYLVADTSNFLKDLRYRSPIL